jgi:hypothetical protein
MESLTARRRSIAAFRCGPMSRIQMGRTRHNSATDVLIYTLAPMSNAPTIPLGKGRKIPPGSRPSLLTQNIEGAFNNTNPKVLAQIMQQCQMPSYLVKWTQAFTTNYTIAFAFDGQSEIAKPFTDSIPQGSLVLPTLFAIAANTFLENPTIHCPYPALSSYVDDICMFQIETRPEDTIPALKIQTEVCLEHAAKAGLSFATNKSELIHCLPESSRNKTKPLDILPTLTIENRTKLFTVQPTRTIKQLGVIIDESLNFSDMSGMLY